MAEQQLPSITEIRDLHGTESWRRLLRRSALVGASLLALISLTVAPSSRSNVASAADSPDSKTLGSVIAPGSLSRSASEIAVLDPAEQLALRRNDANVGRIYPPPQLDRMSVSVNDRGAIMLAARPSFDTRIGDHYAHLTPNNNYVFYTVDPDLQEYVERIVSQAQASHVAVVAMNPKTGAILAIAGKSKSVADVEYHAGFPAASLFKVVTAAAAVEQAGIQPHSRISFRGGTYTLNEWNYIPDPRRDRRSMSVAEALGRSCNPVFGHLGSRYLNGPILSRYAHLFGFNRALDLEAPLATSSALIPKDDAYGLSRTAAGFGEVRISPVHAAAIAAGVANGGLMPRPQLVDKIVSPDGAVIHQAQPQMLQRIVQPDTARLLMEMMEHTTTVGTSRREFMRGTKPTLGNFAVAGKTGTLRGNNPVGLNNWFIGAAPSQDPQLAVSVITVDPRYSSKASHLARLVFQKHFNITPVAPEPLPMRKSKYKPSKSYAAWRKPSKAPSPARKRSRK